jgi:hypothetical protein
MKRSRLLFLEIPIFLELKKRRETSALFISMMSSSTEYVPHLIKETLIGDFSIFNLS